MNINPVCWFEIYVNDMPRAKTFYEAVFQGELTLLPNPNPQEMPDLEMWAFPSSMTDGGAAGTLVKMSGFQPGNGGTLIYFSCRDCAEEAQRAQDHGGSIMQPKTPIGAYGFISLVTDTEGNIIGLHSQQ